MATLYVNFFVQVFLRALKISDQSIDKAKSSAKSTASAAVTKVICLICGILTIGLIAFCFDRFRKERKAINASN